MTFIQRLSHEALQRNLIAARTHLEHCQQQFGANHSQTLAAQRSVSNYEQETRRRQPSPQEPADHDAA